jgi:small subunit ribosomal protein S1
MNDTPSSDPAETTVEASANSVSLNPEASEPRQRPSERLQIGSQRRDDASPAEKSQPAGPAVDPGQETDSTTSPSKANDESKDSTTKASESGLPPSKNVSTDSQFPDDVAPSEKTQPATSPEKPGREKEPEHPSQRFPLPNARDALSPELEAEYLAALGDQSLNDLMGSGHDAKTLELEPETRVTGRVSKLYREDIFVDLGGQNQGIVSVRQFDEPPAVGAELELVVSRHNADEGYYELSRPSVAIDVGDWSEVEEGQILEVMITGSNKGGLECQVAGIRGFIPMGQISMYRIETPEDFVGQKLPCVVTEANPERRNLVLSHRAMMERERAEKREKLLAELAPGQLHEGIVRSLREFGAFVDIGGIDGLVHISQLSWDRVNHPSEILKEGQAIKVRIEKVDRESGKIGLSYRDVGANPWDDVESKYPVGQRVMGKVSKIMDFGAFVKLEPGIEGLVHISELAHDRVHRTSDIVSEGQEMEVKVLSLDPEQQRISLSLRALMEPPRKKGQEQTADEDLGPPPDPKLVKKQFDQLKGGLGGPSGGAQFGLKW